MKLWIPLLVLVVIILYRQKIISEWNFFCHHRRDWLREKWKNWGEPFFVAAILAIVIRTFIVGPYKIPTGSMRMTFLEGDRIFVDKITYRFMEPKRGDIIVFKYPVDPKKDFVKRLIGLPGEKLEIKKGRIYVNGKMLDVPPFTDHYYYNRNDWLYGREDVIIEIPQGNYFALGDNSAHSSDSRNWGFVPRKNVVGRAFLIWWPPNRIQLES